MKEYLVCKSCGFVIKKLKLKDKCPACGVSAKMFEPYTENISAFRKFVLSLDLHPVLVHFPQAFIITLLFLSSLGLILHGDVLEKILSATVVLGFALPFVVIAAFGAGILDAKIRFRRLTTPILIRKIVLGSIIFILSSGIFVISVFIPFTQPAILTIFMLAFVLSFCAVVIGLLGSSIANAKFPD
jgi:hypothetical protein